MDVRHYQILQRDAQGWAEAHLSGKLPANAPDDACVWVAAFDEQDGERAADWTVFPREGLLWRGVLRLPEGGPYQIQARLGKLSTAQKEWRPLIATVRRVGVGDVFLLSGQSNMVGCGHETAYDPPEPGVHLYGNDGNWRLAEHPVCDPTNTLYPESVETCGGDISPALAFGRAMKRWLHVPIGLIPGCRGGSKLSQWNPNEDGVLYRAMLKRLRDAGGDIRAIIWYQGCADTSPLLSETYYERFMAMMEAWTRDIGSVPIVTVQINRDDNDRSLELDRGWGLVRDAQRRAVHALKMASIVTSSDLAQADGIHNSSGSNVIMGERIAKSMLALLRGKPISPPEAVSAKLIGEREIIVTVENADELRIVNRLGDDFSAEDVSGIASCVTASAEPGELRLSFERALTPPAWLHGGWRAWINAMPRALKGWPMLSFYGLEVGE